MYSIVFFNFIFFLFREKVIFKKKRRFHPDGAESEERSRCPPHPQHEAKGKAVTGGKVGLRGVTKQPPVTYSPADETQWLSRRPKSKRRCHRGKQAQRHYSVTELHGRRGQARRSKTTTCSHTHWGRPVSKRQIKQAVTKLQDPDWPRSMP